jgi:hypothetical protein
MRLLSILILATIACTASAQSKTRFPAWTFNTQETKINGLSVGYFTTERIKNVTTNGMRFELLGWGIFLPLIPNLPISQDDSTFQQYLKTSPTERINGFNISPLGTGCSCDVNGLNVYGMGSIMRKVNGLSAGVFMNAAEIHNGVQVAYYFNFSYKMNGLQAAFINNKNYGVMKGIQLAGLWNEAQEIHGLQIGIYNRAAKMKGVQVGIWNDNGKRKRPILNFGT